MLVCDETRRIGRIVGTVAVVVALDLTLVISGPFSGSHVVASS